jgi:hypothetical protein
MKLLLLTLIAFPAFGQNYTVPGASTLPLYQPYQAQPHLTIVGRQTYYTIPLQNGSITLGPNGQTFYTFTTPNMTIVTPAHGLTPR